MPILVQIFAPYKVASTLSDSISHANMLIGGMSCLLSE
jgi:hypothetical protein